MAATDIGELVISLAFESGDAKAEMKALTREVGNLDKHFLAVAAEAGHFGKGLDGAKNQAKSLTAQMEMQKRVVQQAGKDLAAANQKLLDAQARQASYKTKIDATTAAHEKLGAELKDTRSQWDAAKAAMGENSDEANALGAKVLELEDAYKKSGEELKKLNSQYKRSGTDIKKAGSDLQYYAGQEDQAKIKAGALKQELDKVNKTVALQSGLLNATALKQYGESLGQVAAKQIAFGKAATMYGTVPILGGAAYAAKQAIGWESSFAGVEKTVDGTAEQLAEIEQGLIDMSEVLPVTKNNLAEVAAEAGQLGIQTPNVLGFTRTMADLKESTNLGDEGASQMAKFANITQMAQTNFDRAGSTLVDLGNNMATTEADIMSMSMRLAGAGKQVGMNEASIMGFSAALSSLGIEAEAGGSSFSKLMVEMQLAVETGSEALKDYSKIAGMTGAEFQTAFKEDAAGAISAFIAGLGSGGESAIKILDDIGISEVRMRDALLRASNATGLFSGAISMANGAWKDNTALAAEASKRYATFESRLKMAGNQAANAAMTFGEDLMPALEGGLDFVTDLIGGFSDLNEQTRGFAMNALLVTAGIGPAVTLVGKGNQVIATASKGLAALKTASVAAGGGMKGLLSATAGLMGPVGVAALGAAVMYGAYKLYDYASGAKAAREALKDLEKQAEEWANTQAKTIYDTGNDPFARFGLEKSDFGGGIDESKDWLTRLNETWTDGKGETSEIVKSYVDEFADGSDKIREAIKARQKIQKDLGVDDSYNEEQLKQLDAYDKEVERLLKKRQNGFLTEDEQARLNKVITARAQIQLEYVTGEGGGYETIRKGVEAEKARIEAETAPGDKVEIGADLYTDALTAGAQGYQAQVDALNASYHEQYAAVAAISDEKEREAALTELNTRHQEALNAAKSEYKGLVSDYGREAFQDEGVQKAKDDMQAFVDVIDQFNRGEIDGTGLKAFTDTLDEGELASYIALLSQMKESGLGDMDLGGGLTANQLLGGYETVTEFLEGHAGSGFDELGKLLGAAGDEAMRVLMDLGLSEEGQTLKDTLDGWEANGIQTTIAITGYSQETGEAMTIQGININPVTGAVEGYDQKTGTVYSIGGVNINPETGEVTAYNQATGEALTISGVNIDPETGEISGYDQKTGTTYTIGNVSINPEKGEITGYDQATGTSYKIGNVNINPETGVITAYNQVTGAPMKIQGVSLQGETGVITGYVEGPNITKPEVQLTGTITAVKLAKGDYEKEPVSIAPESWTFSAEEKVGVINDLAQGIKDLQEAGGDTSSGRLQILDQLANLTPDDLGGIAGYATTLIEALSSGSLGPEEAAAAQETLNSIIAMLQVADEYLGVGNDISAGIAEGLTGYGWTTDATTVVTDIETALRNAAGSHSPATKYKPVGSDISAGVGLGMRGYSFALDAAATAMGAESALDAALKDVGLDATGKKYGGYLMDGIDDGLEGKRSTVVSTAQSIADEIKETIRKAWDINSPSGEGEWLSEMLMEGIELPIAREVPNIIGMLDDLELKSRQSELASIASAAGGGGGGGVVIDYDKLARAMAARPLNVHTEVGGKELARTMVQPNVAEKERWEASRDAGYGR